MNVYRPIFLQELKKAKLYNPKIIRAYYEKQEFMPQLVTLFFANNKLDSLVSYLELSKADGFNPDVFMVDELKLQLKKLKDNNFSAVDRVYPVIAKLEIRAAESLLKYYNYMKYGVVEPRYIFNRYYIQNKRPDSLSMIKTLTTNDILAELKDAQPKSKTYTELKKQLAHYRDSLHNENDFSIRQIKLNMERMRWRLPVETDEIVVINIPDFSLTWFKGNDTLARMNVCVGEKREANYAEKIKIYMKSGKFEDKPKNHETPQLISTFNAIQVNPVWNIPMSIAQNEIYYMASKDPFYLEKNNIKVFYKGKPVNQPDTIKWNKYKREKLPFKFKQGSGEDNALGRFKFVFESNSSIYLHDTNNKYGFKLANRALSHGCIRIEDPLKMAELLVKNKYQYDNLRMNVYLPPIDTALNDKFLKKLALRSDTTKTFTLKPSWFAVRKNVGLLLVYYTAWAENGKLKLRPDIYQYDEILWAALKRYVL